MAKNKIANNVRLCVFSREGEPELTFLKKLIPLDLSAEKLRIESRTALGFNEQKIRILEILLEKERHTTAFIRFLLENLTPEQKAMLLRQAESRMDDDCNFYMRLERPSFFSGKFWITDSGDCFHIKINVACFPRKRELALERIKELFLPDCPVQ